MPKLTKRLVESIDPTKSGTIIWDTEIPGFGVRVGASGRPVYIVKYRDGAGRQRKPRIGTHGAITVEQARKIAQQMTAAVARGENPAAEKEAARKAPSMQKLGDRYLDEYARPHKRKSSIDNDERLIEKRINPALGATSINTIERADILRLHKSLEATPYEANRVLSLLSKMFNLAELWGLRPDGSNPCRHVQRYKEHKRDRFLLPGELARLGETLKAYETERTIAPQIIACIRLLMFTGCRLSEITTLKWVQVDFDSACIRLATSKTGPKTVQLGTPALKILADLDRADDNPYVIPGAKPGAHIVNMQKPWRKIRARAGLDDVRLHDLRHTFAACGASSGLSLPIIGKMLGHTQPQTTQRYAHLADDPLRRATEAVSGQIAAAMAGEDADVVQLENATKLR